jgi:carboxyl-terminal processing protease
MSRPIRYLLSTAIAVILLAGAFSGGLVVGWLVPMSALGRTTAPLGLPPIARQPGDLGSGTPAELNTLFQPFWQSWQIVTDRFIDQPVDTQKMMRGAIHGMLASLNNAYTSYMDPSEYQISSSHLNSAYEGIGARVDITGAYVKIISAMPGSPAEKAGLLPNDTILKVDGQDMTGVTGKEVLTHIMGPANSKVTLTIQREGSPAPFDVTLQRAKIRTATVESKMLDNKIAYIRLTTFGETTGAELKDNLTTLMAQKPSGLILDLRNNGGGYLTTAIEVISQFIDKGTLMYEVYGNGTRKAFTATSGGLALNIPMIVMVNKDSASASEITAGAIQDLGRGKLLGETTFGKGEVQEWIPLNNNQGAIRVTVARWLTPNERQIQGKGLAPDVEVPMTEQDITDKKDPQLDRALNLLKTSQP